MAVLVHLAPAKSARSIRRSGIKAVSGGVYCMPLLPNYYVSHQWLRELKRRGQRTIVAVDFRVSSDEPVWVGHYGPSHQQMSLGRAIARIMAQADPCGFELIIPRSIRRGETLRIRTLRQVIGWRYSPDSHGKAPTCACRMCLSKGTIKSRRLRDRLDPTGEMY
jgi:hypothetical protein